MASIIKNRSELLFLYDVSDANPNGDPNDENKPRIDEETGINIVTDVRLKRTIRDYLFENKGYNGENGKDIFVRQTESKNQKKGISDGKERAGHFENNKEAILEKCIDIRLFGGVLPLEKASITFTGPVQFQMGRSLHKVSVTLIKGTGAFASKAGASQQTFREEYILPYSFIAYHGIINENAAKHTGLTDEDVNLLLEAMWEGTKGLISRSKFGQMPRLLLKIDYKDNFFIGELHKLLKIVPTNNIEDTQIRGTNDFTLDVSELNKKIDACKDKISKVNIINQDASLNLTDKILTL